MYTAILKDRVVESGKIRFVVQFSNGTDVFTESYNSDKYVDLQPRVAARLAVLNYVDTFTIGATIDPTLPVTPAPTAAEIARNTWLNDWRLLQAADKLVAAGVITNTLPAYVAHKAKVVNNFQVSYVPFLF